MVYAVFVDADGAMTPRAMTRELSMVRFPRRESLMIAYANAFTDLTTDDYYLRGRMFDGRPVYVPNGFDVAEVRVYTVTDARWVTETDQDNRTHARNLVAEKKGHILDEWCGAVVSDPDEVEELKAQHLVKRGVRILAMVQRGT